MKSKPVKDKTTAKQEERKISRMINSALFFLHYVFILKEPHSFRLVIVQNKRKLFDWEYDNLEDAKAACIRIIREKNTFKKRLSPRWSFFYPVDEKWLEDKLTARGG